MAAQTFPNYSRDVRHGKSGSGSSLNYGPVPGSPTLTNPDMILPDYDCDVSLDERSQSPIRMWNNVQTSDMRFHLPSSQNQFIAGPITPSTPIIYGNGTMLSDIGEVTEVESVIGKGGRRGSAHLSVYSNDDHVLGSSPTMGVTRIKSRSQILQRERKSSIDSNSTITSQGRAAPFGDFDDSVSVDDVNFQGDDEESMASSYVEGTAVREPKFPRIARTQEATEQRYSTSSLSDRAEQILANAKQRLTAADDGGQPVKGKKLFIYSDVRWVNPFSSNRSTCNILKRVYHPSEFDPGFPQRSASALGAAGGYRQPLTSSRSADALGIGYGATSHRSPTTLDPMLETLSEDEGGANGDSRRSSHLYNQLSPTFGSMTDTDMPRSASVAQVRDLKHQMKDLRGKISSLKEQARADSLKRRSLQSLRTPSPFTHARWDQGLPESRTSQETTPETPAWQAPWNQGSPKDKVNGQMSSKEGSKQPSEEPAKTLDAGAEHGFRTSDAPDVVVAQEQSDLPQFEAEPDLGDDIRVQTQVQENDDMNDDGETWEGDLEQEEEDFKQEVNGYGLQNGEYNDDAEDDDDDEFVDFESESGESSYHDAFQTPVSHEDREDAFDYEHFFLHSAMGTMSQHRRESWSSVSSGDSVETTRGPIVASTSAPDSDSDHERRPSVDTMSSFNSFATATEGRLSRNSEFEDATETIVIMPGDSDAPLSSKRATFGNFKFPRSGAPSRNGSVDYHQSHPRRSTVVRRPSSSAATYARHRPSMSSFGSTGTNRSFPLVDKSKGTNGILTPTGTPGGSPDSELRQISESLLNEAAGLGGIEGGQKDGNTSAVHGLDKESQILVERLVASLGKCVLGLTESSRAGTEARMYRRRIDAARRILEGLEE
ncbi:hypothetical protein FPCIR_3692 [Fusarium pseudocircinatum]|uniref:Uncharacterized protein n=1 Tax=Fusarium pseudocircinatum TaxID=56676 RepID=A0A8H5PHN0_9HYPO|nr:hypothetical protein FPCIR_3692 [Fusarium pseudocircinatum]